MEFLHAEHAIFLEADGELLARLFGNLLNNAVKYGKEGKQIRVSMEKEGEYGSRVSLTTDDHSKTGTGSYFPEILPDRAVEEPRYRRDGT